MTIHSLFSRSAPKISRSIALALVAAVWILGAPSCSDDGPNTVVGTWLLESIGGQALPQPFDATTTIHFDELDVGANGFEQHRIRTANNAPNTPVSQNFTGAWDMMNNVATFITTGGATQETYSATWSGKTMSRVRNGETWLYRKQ